MTVFPKPAPAACAAVPATAAWAVDPMPLDTAGVTRVARSRIGPDEIRDRDFV